MHILNPPPAFLFGEQHRCAVRRRRRHDVPRLKQRLDLRMQLIQFKTTHWIQLPTFRWQSRVNQFNGKWGAVGSDRVLWLVKHFGECRLQFTQQFMRALKSSFLDLPTMGRSVCKIKVGTLLNQCQVDWLLTQEVSKLCS